jgi:hypothetical protein
MDQTLSEGRQLNDLVDSKQAVSNHAMRVHIFVEVHTKVNFGEC